MSRQPIPPVDLRSAAEARLATAVEAAPPVAVDNVEALLHELRVHQIELEMQNDALRQAQIELEESRDHYVDLYEFAPLGYLTLSTSGLIEQINLTGATLLGSERKPLLLQRFARFVADEDQDRWQRLFMQVKQLGEKVDIELAMQRSYGARFEARLDCQYLDSAVPRVRVAVTDISESKRLSQELAREHQQLEVTVKRLAEALDAAEAANRAKSAFLSNMSHECHAPTSGILGVTGLVRRGGEPDTAPATEAELRLRRDFPAARILLVEADPLNQEVVMSLLRSVGLAPELAENGMQAVQMATQKAAQNAYRLILMDLQLHEMNGLDATRAIRGLPGHHATPILAMTANAFDDDRRARLAAGMDGFIDKPVIPETLFATILGALSK